MSKATSSPPTTSFTTKKINSTTFLIREDDAYGEYPFIYAKLHPSAPVLILSDTGSDEPSSKFKQAKYTRLRDFLESYPVSSNENKPINPGGERKYIIILSHCHYDHTLGVPQFLEGGTTEIVASAAGRDFIESDLERHGEFQWIGRPAPWFQVTHWAQAFERLQYPLSHDWDDEELVKPIDLGITFILQAGHTPDSLAWYDHDEMHLYVGDSFYEEGKEDMPIIWTGEGNFIEWAFSMQKLQYFVKSENARAEEEAQKTSVDEGWEVVAKKVKIGCAHQTHTVDGEEIMARLEKLFVKTLRGEVPVTKKEFFHDDAYYTWREKGWKMHFMAPARRMDDARRFFKGTGLMEKGWSGSLDLGLH